MLRYKSISTLLLLITIFLVPIESTMAEEDGIVKVVYHADFADPRRFSAMLTSINNMLNYYENDMADYDVRIVFVAHGIRFVTDDKLVNTPFAEDKEMADRRKSLKGRLNSLREVRGVKLELCDITRTQVKLDKTRLYPGVESVPSGVVQIVDLQRKGFAYLKVE
jgi:hypothetical protein